jgi:5-methylcytosine-specific restriction endonuclease McrA
VTQKVLLLNASYEPLNICSWKRAIVLLIKGKAIAVESQSTYLAPDTPLPLVIRLLHYIRIPHKSIPLTRKNLMHRDRYTCQYCGKMGGDLTVDHVLPRSRGGRDEWENVVVACLRCNVGKGNRTPEEAGLTLHRKISRPVNFAHFELSKHWTSAKTEEYAPWQKYMYGA